MGLYKGGLATLVKTSSNYGIRFCAFADARERLIQASGRENILIDLTAGGWAGFISTLANNPVDVVKTKMQGLDSSRHPSFLRTFSQIYANDGFYGFYKGIRPRMLRVCIEQALTFGIFHSIKRNLLALINHQQH